MGAVDPTYPLYPIVAIISAVLLLLVFLSSFVRQSWNLGVTFLCFWLFFENLTAAVNAIVWSDNADIKLYIYCDIVSHLQLIAYVVKPMSTLLIMRRLYLIANLRSVDCPGKSARRWDCCIEWTLGLIIPVLIAGPAYFVVQGSRFIVEEGIGCGYASVSSVVSLVLIDSWTVMAPLLSTVLYYPKVAMTLYRQSREFNCFLRSNRSISRTNYIRILALASINIVIILTFNLTMILFEVLPLVDVHRTITLYNGWSNLHTDWSPLGFSWADVKAGGKLNLAIQYLDQWASVAHSFAIFALFGLTVGARASYWRAICTVAGWFGWKPTWRGRSGATRSVLSSIRFNRNRQAQEVSLASCEPLGYVHRSP
ncbi:fungal pheromone STE3G-protein-coupled receptor [Peniophora sp. CONT]|nr:fungal pheromone STE3G-protein-coupled receptor [Peniophora sp. CONT]